MNNENREVIPGETMFDYLKRKKKFMLEKTVKAKPNTRSPLHEKNANTSTMDFEQTRRDEQSRRQSSRDQTKREQGRDKSGLKENNESQTTRRTPFIQPDKKPLHRSFIQMISPNRSKSPAKELERQPANKQNSRRDSKENYTKKMLTDKVNMMRDTIETQLRGGRSLKEKAHSLFLDLKPFLRHVQDCPESGLQRKTQEIKAKIRVLQSIFKQLNGQNHQQAIDEFYMHFSQYLNELEGQAKAQITQNKDSLTAQISSTKNRQIDELNHQNLQLKKELAILNKRYSKLQRTHEQLSQQTQTKAEQSHLTFQERLSRLQAQLADRKEQNQFLTKQIQQIKQAKTKLQEERKQLISQKQRFQQECLNTITKVKSEQEEFLLNEILVLKKEFSIDLSKMAELYKIKEEDLLKRLTERDRQISQLNKNISDLLQGNKNLDDSLGAVQAQSMRIKKQNQCLATDMHRINEQLYQHWLALKDIKTLSQRLDIFYKFKKIYDELLFNEQLFL